MQLSVLATAHIQNDRCYVTQTPAQVVVVLFEKQLPTSPFSGQTQQP